jgi:hypothetical protein
MEGSVLMQEFILMVGIFLSLIGFVMVQSHAIHVHSIHGKTTSKKQIQRSRRLGADAMIMGGSMVIFTWLDLFTKHWNTTDTGIGIAIIAGLIGIMEFRRRNA